MKEKEWTIVVNQKEYNIKIQLNNIFGKIKMFLNEKEVKMNKEYTCLRAYTLGVYMIFIIENKKIIIFIDNNTIDLAIDGYFLERKKQCFYNEDKKSYLAHFYIFISWITIFILDNWFSYILFILTTILYIRINLKIYMDKKEKTLINSIVAIIHWTLILILKIYKIHI